MFQNEVRESVILPPEEKTEVVYNLIDVNPPRHHNPEQNTSITVKSVSPSIEERVQKMKSASGARRSNSPPTNNTEPKSIFLKQPLKKLNSESIQQRNDYQKIELSRTVSKGQNKEHSFMTRGNGGSVTDMINALNRNQKSAGFSKQMSSGSSNSSEGSSLTNSPITVNTNLSPSRSPQHSSPGHQIAGGSSGTRPLIEEFEHKQDERIYSMPYSESSERLVNHDGKQASDANPSIIPDKIHTIRSIHNSVEFCPDSISTSDVDESYNSDLDENNTSQSPVLSELIKRVHVVENNARQKEKNQPAYIFILTDVPESKDYGRVKLLTSRYPTKRLKQAQMFNPNIRMHKSVKICDRTAAFEEAKLSLLECREMYNTANENSESCLPGNWFTSQSFLDVNIILEEVEDKYVYPSRATRLKSQENDAESEC